MKFYLLDIEASKESNVVLYTKQVEEPHKAVKVHVENVFTPVLMVPTHNNLLSLEADLMSFLGARKLKADVSRMWFKNYFYNFEETIEMLRVECAKPFVLQEFSSPSCVRQIREFANPVENFIISRRIRGSGVIEIENYEESTSGECFVKRPGDVVFVGHDAFPPLKFLTMSLTMEREEIVLFSVRVDFRGESKFFCNGSDSGEHVIRNTESLIAKLCKIIVDTGPDVVIFYNVPESILRRLALTGKILCDIYQVASSTLKGRSFSLDELSVSVLGTAPNATSSSTRCTQPSANDAIKSVNIIYKIFNALDVLDLCKELTEICGNLLRRSVQNYIAERNEYLLLHEFYARGILFPPKKRVSEVSYRGGLVLEPEVGFYETMIMLLDFNSLYPSIIQEYNICFSTVCRRPGDDLEDDALGSASDHPRSDACGYSDGDERSSEPDLDNVALMSALVHKGRSKELGVLPTILKNLVSRRKHIKESLRGTKGDTERRTLNLRQKALKLTANSIYGCLGTPVSRFCNFEMAALITQRGRDILTETKVLANSIGLSVIYGDTDSIMINTKIDGFNSNTKKAQESIEVLRTCINKKYRYIEIEVECVIKKLLLLTKKKYGALVVGASGSCLEAKGLDFLRRDFCELSADISHEVFEILMTDLEENEEMFTKLYGKGFDRPDTQKPGGHADVQWASSEAIAQNPALFKNDGNKALINHMFKRLAEIKQTIHERPVDSFVINSVLSRPPEKYATPDQLPHVSLALRMREKGIMFKKDDVVSYVVGLGKKNESISKRAYLANEKFDLDYDYYVTNQILPPIYRLVSLFRLVSLDAVNKIFGVLKLSPKAHYTNLTFLSPCCSEPQEFAFSCKKCRAEIRKSFYVTKVLEIIRQETHNLYTTPLKCIECNFETFSPILTCPNCCSGLTYEPNNAAFDTLLQNIHDTMESKIEDVDRVIGLYFRNSRYRKIELRAFSDEIDNYYNDA